MEPVSVTVWDKSEAVGRPSAPPVLEHARELYLSSPYSEQTWSAALKAQTRQHVNEVLAEIHRSIRTTSNRPLCTFGDPVRGFTNRIDFR